MGHPCDTRMAVTDAVDTVNHTEQHTSFEKKQKRQVVYSLSLDDMLCQTVAGQLNSPSHDLVILDLPFVLLIKHIRHGLLISL